MKPELKAIVCTAVMWPVPVHWNLPNCTSRILQDPSLVMSVSKHPSGKIARVLWLFCTSIYYLRTNLFPKKVQILGLKLVYLKAGHSKATQDTVLFRMKGHKCISTPPKFPTSQETSEGISFKHRNHLSWGNFTAILLGGRNARMQIDLQ